MTSKDIENIQAQLPFGNYLNDFQEWVKSLGPTRGFSVSPNPSIVAMSNLRNWITDNLVQTINPAKNLNNDINEKITVWYYQDLKQWCWDMGLQSTDAIKKYFIATSKVNLNIDFWISLWDKPEYNQGFNDLTYQEYNKVFRNSAITNGDDMYELFVKYFINCMNYFKDTTAVVSTVESMTKEQALGLVSTPSKIITTNVSIPDIG